jgi:hypothetical protein
MITDVLLDHSALVAAVFGLVALACVGIGYAGVRGGVVGRRLLWALAGLSALVVLALTLSPGGQTGRDTACTVQFALPTLTRVELLANVALFVPPVLFATLATRRPLLVVAAAVGASAAIEGLQAAVPAIGRACDTNDWLMNALGVLVGALLATSTRAIARRTSGRRPRPVEPGRPRI